MRNAVLILLLTVAGSLAAGQPATLPPNVTKFATYTPQPEYPAEALKRHMIGSGFFVLRVDRASGSVVDVEVRRTTGIQILDKAALKALRQWRFKPGGALPTKDDPRTAKYSRIGVPVAFR